MLAETEEVPYECGPRQKYPMLFEEPLPLQVNGIQVLKYRVSSRKKYFIHECQVSELILLGGIE